MKRREKGEGSIIEYKKGHFRGFIDLGKDPVTGKRKRKTFTGSSKKEVITKLNQYNYEKQTGILTINSSTPFNLFLNHWLKIKANTIKDATLREYKGLCRKYFIPLLGSTPINEITTSTINTMFIHSSITSKQKTTQKNIKRVLASIFLLAIKEGIITNSPCTLSEPIRARKPNIHPLSDIEINKLLTKAKESHINYMYCLIRLAIETGARRGELLALTYKDINIKESTISFNKSINQYKVVNTTKTQASNRVVYVSPETIKELYLIKHPDTNIIFHNGLGNYIHPITVSNQFKQLIKECGLPSATRFHDLRHTNATILISKGIDMKTVSTRLGHTSITTTMDRYVHAVKEEDKKAAQIISESITVASN